MTPRFLLALLILVACLALGSQPARAHAALIGSDPQDGAILSRAPERLLLHFSEPVSPLVLRLTLPQGGTSELSASEVRGQVVVLAPPAGLGNGTYVLSWRVVSADGHPVGGSLVFSIGASHASGRQAMKSKPDIAVLLGLWSLRVLLYVGLFAGVGGAFFVAWIIGRSHLRRDVQPVVLCATACGLVAALLTVGWQGLDALAVPVSALTDRAVWLQGWRTTYGTTAAVAVMALLAGGLSVKVRAGFLARALSGAALIGVGIALAASGHAGTAEPRWLTRTSVFVHTTGLAFWLGALVPLFLILRSAHPRAALFMDRFSTAVLPVVIALLVAGATLAIVQLRSFAEFWTTAYGRILLAKLLAVSVLLALAATNRFVLTPALRAGVEGCRRRFAQVIAAEGVLVLLILGLVAGWRFTPPPRASVIAPAAPVSVPEGPTSVHIHTGEGMAEVTFDPGRVGKTAATIELFDAAGAPLEPKEVALVLSQRSAGIEPLQRQAMRVGDGTWRVDDLVLPVPGRWQIRVDALVTDFDKLMLEDEIEIRP
ncbi:copper resistance protein CopC [Microvirga massiliensis]|uniref:copper resistance CopC/CopD family protein n=1 Tax=Microvirga massiliensis TaxID=1033741 RepID=UPI00062B8949|nr:copper resistance protein CopC [Microvirga massiliensis]